MAGQSLCGRAAEVAEIDHLVERARAGAGGGVLILRGEAGIGKTALLDHAAAGAAGTRVLRGGGIEAEAGVPFAALHLLLGAEAGRVEELSAELPAPQAAALQAALGLTRPRPEDRLLVGLALLTLLSGPEGRAPVLVLVDDAQWLDRESADALLFAARRAAARGIVFLFAARDDAAWPRTGLPELRLTGLAAADARLLLAERAPDTPAARRDRAVEQARGNPLALIAFAAAESGLLARVPAEFERAVRGLPEPARTLLAVVAADDTGEPGVAVRAAESLGVPFGALEPAEDAGLVTVTRTSIGFRHPLARAAAYQGVPVTRRIAVHRALAAAHARTGDAGPRVRHLSAAALGTDEAVAAELEAAAGDLAGRRVGPSVAAFAYERAARLAGDPEVRARRLAAAAEAELSGGRPDRARALADEAARATCAPDTRARVDLVRAGLELEHGVPEAAGRLLLERAASCDDPEVRARMLEEAAFHAWSCGDAETAARAVAAHPGGSVLVRALSALLGDDLTSARRVLAGCPDGARDERLRLLAAESALLGGDDAAAAELSAQLVAHCRDGGLLAPLPRGLAVQAWSRLLHGAHDDARELVREALRIAAETGQRRQAAALRAIQARQAAMEGDEVRCRALAADGRAGAALGLLALGLGRPEDALEHLQDAHGEAAGHAPPAVLALADTVEAAVAAGRPDAAAAPMARLAAYTRAAGQPWADGVAARCRALLTADDAEADRLFTLALAAHRGGGRPFERARTELLYGEWLRRSRRRARARSRLGAALETFERLGAVPWAERARGELRAAGQGVRPCDPPGRLTAQEMQVVRLAMTGATNRQIAARLRLSHRTVAYHLYKAFPKLGVASRAELHRYVPAAEPGIGAGAERPA
ncbi:LuxR family transcriptional regulator [Actinomadura sp. 6K520]|uniref:AAA family ATPase n=1 Tax=Actinomadura sp. 6K520 TaxID=2530364 RepID=UPI00105010A1|nr:LuxR family transcriptional regulator [Actinomadura sp. 6K520]TDE33843.1 helix-turn-helix transcriptional regulator [Actinomadura sp. 6K520]